jgi:hypothetical protein
VAHPQKEVLLQREVHQVVRHPEVVLEEVLHPEVALEEVHHRQVEEEEIKL